MKVAVFSSKPYDETFLEEANRDQNHTFTFFEPRLTEKTVQLAKGYDAVCVFVNDQLNETVLRQLHTIGVRTIALRCAGFNNVDLKVAETIGLEVVRVPAYSPHAVAEHTIALLLTVNRKIHRAYNRVREGNFALDGLLGFDLYGKTVGLIGTGKIGRCTADIFAGFGCEILAYDPYPHEEMIALGVKYVELTELFSHADIISLHCPLTPDTYHLLDQKSFQQMKEGVIILNTSRGAMIDASAIVDALKSGKIGGLGLDVYEEEADLFFEDLSGKIIQDDVFARLLTFPNVVITGHQGFFTEEALRNISQTTVDNLNVIEAGEDCENAVTLSQVS